MDNHILLQLIEKDLDELNLLIKTLKSEESISAVLIQIVLAKSKTLQQEISMLTPGSIAEQQPVITTERIENEFESIEQLEEDLIVEEETVEEIVAPVVVETPMEPELPEPKTNAVVEVKEEIVEQTFVETKKETSNESEIVEENVIHEHTIETETETTKTIVGERYASNASLYDRIGNIGVQSKIQPKPIASLKGAIGINDRFLYQRSLFQNDAYLMSNTIDKIDAFTNIEQAIDYLELNFEWPEDEVSLKFLALIKRRFQL